MEIVYDYQQLKSYKDIVFGGRDEYLTLHELQCIVEYTLRKVPQALLDACSNLDWKLVVTNKRNLEQEYNYDIKILGLTDYTRKEFIIYADKVAISQSIYHELGHFIDYLLDVTSDERWQEIYNSDKQYYPQGVFTQIDSYTECFADGYLWYLTEDTKLSRLDKTCRVFDNITNNLEYLLNLSEVKDNYVKKRNEIDSKDSNKLGDILSVSDNYFWS